MALHQFDVIIEDSPPKENTQHPKSFWLPVEIALFTLLAFLAFAPVAGVWFGIFYASQILSWKNPWDKNGTPGYAIVTVIFIAFGAFATSCSIVYALAERKRKSRVGWIVVRVWMGLFSAVFLFGTIIGAIECMHYNIFGLHW
jgi:hypothetical protein